MAVLLHHSPAMRQCVTEAMGCQAPVSAYPKHMNRKSMAILLGSCMHVSIYRCNWLHGCMWDSDQLRREGGALGWVASEFDAGPVVRASCKLGTQRMTSFGEARDHRKTRFMVLKIALNPMIDFDLSCFLPCCQTPNQDHVA